MNTYSRERFAVMVKPDPYGALFFESLFALRQHRNAIFPNQWDIFTNDIPGQAQLRFKSAFPAEKLYDGYEEIVANDVLELLRRNYKLGDGLPPEKKLTTFVRKYASQRNREIDVELAEICEEFNLTVGELQVLMDNLFVAATTVSLRERGKYVVPLFSNCGKGDSWLTSDSLEDGVELAITDIPIVDPSLLTWEDTNNLWEDRDRAHQLRRLRLFLDELNEKSKGKAWVNDKISEQIYQHERVIKHAGLKTKVGDYKAILNMKQLHNLIAFGGLSFLLPSAAVPLAALGIKELIELIREVSGLMIRVKEAKVEQLNIRNESNVEYLMRIKGLADENTSDKK